MALYAQSSSVTGEVRGLVLDSSSLPVAGATVVVTAQETGFRRRTQAGDDGQYSVRGLPPGTYTIRIEAPGFAPMNRQPFALSVGQVVSERFELALAGVTESIEVKEEPEAIDVTAPSASVALGYERIEEAPARSRNYLNFVLAAPAVAPAAGASSQRTMTGIRSPLGDSGFTFAGMRPRNNAIQIDGLDNRDETTGGNRVAVGLEMVQEFRVASTAVDAEFGGAAGGLLNMVTRSGVNIWHGDLTFFAQHEKGNATQPEVTDGRRPRFRRYQPGVSANGPLRRDRSFISGALEHEKESAEEWSNVPVWAIERLNAALASPLYSGANLRLLRGLYPTSTRGTELSLKWNHQPNERDTFSARYAYSRGRVRAEVQGPQNFADQSAQGSSVTVDHSLVGNWLRVVSPTIVNDVRMQVAGRDMDLSPNGSTPMFEIPGVVTAGQFYRFHSSRAERHYQVQESFNVVVGKHRLGLGTDVHGVTLDATLRNKHAGLYVFPSLDLFLGGQPDLFIQAFGDPATRLVTVPLAIWLQDRWEARRGLTVELGARYDRQRMPSGITPSSNNLSPRAGLAWRPFEKRPLVVRVGTGLFFDRYPLAYLNEAVQKDGVRGYEQYAVGPAAVRALTLSRGALLSSPIEGVDRSFYRTSTDFPSTFGRKLTLGGEYGIGNATSVSVEASHHRGFHLPRIRNTTGLLPPRYELEQTARSDYSGVSISLNRRMTKELAYLVAYNFGRTKDDGSDFDEQPLDALDIRRDWGWSRQHQRHRLAASAVFEVPVEWLEGISFAPIASVGSGRPMNALLTTDVWRTGAYPLSARPVGMARNSFFSQGAASLDLRVMKTFPLMENRAVLQVGIESFNLLNHTNTERVSQYYSAPAGRLASYGLSLESLPARQIQFLMQFEY